MSDEDESIRSSDSRTKQSGEKERFYRGLTIGRLNNFLYSNNDRKEYSGIADRAHEDMQESAETGGRLRKRRSQGRGGKSR